MTTTKSSVFISVKFKKDRQKDYVIEKYSNVREHELIQIVKHYIEEGSYGILSAEEIVQGCFMCRENDHKRVTISIKPTQNDKNEI